jgi:hypothetical protein
MGCRRRSDPSRIAALLAGDPGYQSAEWLRISPAAGDIYDLALFVPVILSYVIIKRQPLTH